MDTAGTHEPALAQLPDGTLFVAGSSYSETEPVDAKALWKSSDKGATWSSVNVGGLGDGYVGNGDVDLATGSDGTLYFAAEMRSPTLSHMIGIGATMDGGTSWTWSILTARPHAVRPWIEVTPSGRAHVIWTDMDGLFIHHAISDDRGRTWKETSNPAQTAAGSGLAVGPDGTAVVRIKPAPGIEWERYPGPDGVVASTDGGQNWIYTKLPGTRDHYSGNPDRRADPVASDSAGTIFSAWGAGNALILAASTDRGLTWSMREVASGVHTVWFPRLEAGPKPAELAITWFTKAPGGNFTAHLAHVTPTAGGSSVRQDAFYADVDVTTVSPGGEYIQAVFPKDGGIAIVTKFYLPGPPERTGFAFRVFE